MLEKLLNAYIKIKLQDLILDEYSGEENNEESEGIS